MTHTGYSPGNLPETYEVKNASELLEVLALGNGMGADALVAIGDEDNENGRVIDHENYDTNTRASEVYTDLTASRGADLVVDNTNHGSHEGFSYALTDLGEEIVRDLNSHSISDGEGFIGSDQQHARLDALENQENLEALVAAYHHTPPNQLYRWASNIDGRNDLEETVDELSEVGLIEADERMEENVANRTADVLSYDTTNQGRA